MDAEMHRFAPQPAVLSSPARLNRRNAVLQHFAQVLMIIVLAFLSYLFISSFLLQSVKVVGRSMSPTLENDDRYLLNRWVLLFRDPRPGEIVVIKDPVDNGFSVKRVIAGAGDHVEVKQGFLFINGDKASETYLPPNTPTYTAPPRLEQTFDLKDEEFFVLGDNRLNSSDSRVYGPVAKDRVIGLLVH